MSRYHTFTAADAVEYARQFGQIADPLALVTADEIGDGNLNLVFKIRDAAGMSRVIVKQALPYVRCVGESWPLTLDRARIEAETLLTHGQFCPQHTVNVLHHDAELAVMVQEDLSDHEIWRSELVKGKYYPQAAGQLAEYLAQTLFHTSDFYQSAQAKKAAVSRYTNPELCQITEDLFFTDPYIDHERNNFDPALLPEVLALRQDDALKLAVASLKHRFLSKAEALLHGDIHSGSIFVADGRLKAIDAEFGFYGPIGFDVGTALGNLLLNYCGLPGLAGPRDAAAGREQRLKDIHILWETFSHRFLALCEEKTQDSTLATAGYARLFLQQVWQDAVGYCGSELIRRTIGLAHVADLDSIADDEMRRACQRHALSLGRTLILAASRIDSIDDLIARIRQNG
ncbi:S-methyl-5-thioribose kinase [Yersinia enterocolitica]|uniref:Methylthioribose kinase n=1 Tax=Yersinia enterocolitica serotype O:8 / biotype 1B (strain NCTC 13174 / 8081) TaxID=393305 RepID=MTNK_YERE8|nr:S-methyl-5-thioribose kinase [Yersinia enterocolitica]A1JP08.1 RecName: Full=Methylthioribose kinase; Short=MTR kinase [Yersinia enterocolitica subsp. enterocolitica 8081]AJJ22285.1 S-methyl-5-thioribose kinase [Yersinia enterocolitica]CAL13260.1 probable 5-methylthioribose kinase [Yersinia enterocolitica subsp. enterocolitica 8081]CNG73436.1 methylthioribose kinase [Yersinia enterocolitica]HDL8282845.1 S-methyl-5-thioribose kinase [Yersinia enterocolitica]HDM8288799.1 S-methyl-5-thioribos